MGNRQIKELGDGVEERKELTSSFVNYKKYWLKCTVKIVKKIVKIVKILESSQSSANSSATLL